MPSNPLDAYGLMLSAVEDPNPVLVLLPKALLRAKGTPEQRLPGEPADPDEFEPLNRRPGRRPDRLAAAVAIDAAALRADRVGRQGPHGRHGHGPELRRHLPLCVAAADELQRDLGHTFDVIDLRSIFPYDWAMISESVGRTGRVLIVNEDTEVTNFGEHLLRRVIDDHFYDLLCRPRLLMGQHVPGVGLNQEYERNTVPQPDGIAQALRDLAADAA